MVMLSMANSSCEGSWSRATCLVTGRGGFYRLGSSYVLLHPQDKSDSEDNKVYWGHVDAPPHLCSLKPFLMSLMCVSVRAVIGSNNPAAVHCECVTNV